MAAKQTREHVPDETPKPDFTPDDLAAAGAIDNESDVGYFPPRDPLSIAALQRWEQQKFGVIIHWGLYALIGQAGSWSLCRENAGDFMDPPADWHGTDDEYLAYYQNLRHEFSGADFDAAEWARACARAGMKYAVVTTKHHDGFAMYDTAYSNFKVTAADVPMRRDVIREYFDAFRAHGLRTGAYFSKADWAHPGYWDYARPIPDRTHNFSIDDEPERWRSFVEFTHRQIDELLTRYGDIDVLWLDAGWVKEPREPIDIDQIADNARARQPDILVVDREVHGPNENYRTPEQTVPDHIIDIPWEACITLTRSWCSMMPNEPVKPIRDVIAVLVTVVSRGGNLLLGIGPDATGAMSPHITEGLTRIGEWMDVNGDAIYATEPGEGFIECSPVPGITWRYTQSEGHMHCIALRGDAYVPAERTVQITALYRLTRAHILGSSDAVALEGHGHERFTVTLPPIDVPYAFTLTFEGRDS